jgi:amidase
MEGDALKHAAEVDAALARRDRLGPFHGVPVTIKESYGIAGTPNTWGLAPFKDQRASFTAVAVDRLMRAGAIVVGKTNVPVMLGDWQSYNPNYGATNNPWDLKRTPGGSTGGGAAALAAGIGHLALGSDIGGSIRVPAHFCGVYGHKPTLNLVPQGGHVPPIVPAKFAFVGDSDLAVCGPLARSAEDLLEAVRVLGGPAGDDSVAYRWSLPEPRQKRLRDFRIGCVIDDKYGKPSSDELAVLESTIRTLEKAGAKIDRGWPEGVNPDAQLQNYMFLVSSDMNGRLPAAEREKMRPAYESNPNDPYNAGVFGLHSRWVEETDRRFGARAIWQSWFKSHDVFLTPTAVVPAFPHDHGEPMFGRTLQTVDGPRPYMDMIRWVAPATLAGLPATVAPVGRTAGGLPVGLQIIGPYLEDATPIEFAVLMKEVAGGFEAPPDFG